MPTASAGKRVSPKSTAGTSANVFEALLSDIVRGNYAPGARLPSERELAKTLGASRPTLREALRRLGEWGLIQVKRGSGVVVRPRRDWTLDCLPAYLRMGAPAEGPVALATLLRDLLGIRRAMFVEVVKMVGARLAGRNALAAARQHVISAWESRGDVGAFVRSDYEALRSLVEAAGFLPALWLLGGLAPVYNEIARTLTGTSPAPSDYPETYTAIFDALEAGQVKDATDRLDDYLGRHDQRLLAVLGVNP
jgi:GntR family transcriptional regulator, transcriptional repressor for pyruvate dehydrogenase complex